MAMELFESALISAIIDQRDLKTVLKHKIDHTFFFESTTKAAFIFLVQWYNNPKYNDVPSWESFADSFQAFEPVRTEDSLISLCDKLRQQKLYGDIASVLQEVGELTAGDPTAGFEKLKKTVVTLAEAHTVDESSTLKSSLDDLQSEYLMMRDGDTKLKGYPYPWEALNVSTLGIQREHLVFFYGRPKCLKTWLLVEIARLLHSNGLRVLFLSQELSDLEIKRRFVALASNVNYTQFTRGMLGEEAEATFFETMQSLAHHEDLIVSQLCAGEASITDLQAQIDEYKPDVVLIDSVNYLSADWKELAVILRAMKRTCKSRKVPIVATTHANRSRNKKDASAQDGADDFAYGDSFYQVCDVAVRCTVDIEDRKQRQVKLFTAAIREGMQTLFTVNARLCEDMTQKSVESMVEEGDDIEEQEAIDAMDAEVDERLPEDGGAP
jgi:replicative DNA helicase